MNRPELHRQLQALSRRHPGLHSYTLALRFQAQTGRLLTGPLPSCLPSAEADGPPLSR